jgi:hypothetical protein
MTFATSPDRRKAGDDAPGTTARIRARWFVRASRWVLVALVAPVVASIGILYVVLLPICGIASVLEGFLGATWNWMRANAHPGATMRHNHR